MARIDVYSNDGVTLAATIDAPGDGAMMVIWGTRVFMLDPVSGNYVEPAGSQQTGVLPKMLPRPGIGATDGWKGWDKV